MTICDRIVKRVETAIYGDYTGDLHEALVQRQMRTHRCDREEAEALVREVFGKKEE